ncbi:MAG: hypothetical protein U0234_16900 [Sandaracinus sp.]
MRPTWCPGIVLVLGIGAATQALGCGGTETPGRDGGGALADTGVDAAAIHDGGGDRDAAGHDGGPPVDASMPSDAFAAADAADAADASTGLDAYTAADAYAPTDAATANDAAVTGPTLPVGHCGAQRGRYFPASSWIYTDVSAAPVRSDSAATTTWLTSQGGWGTAQFQIDFSMVVVDATSSSPRYTGEAPGYYEPDCERGVSMPLPAGGHVEGGTGYVCPGGDCHLLVLDLGAHRLYEGYRASFDGTRYRSLCNIAWNTDVDLWGAPPASGTVPNPLTRNWGQGLGCTSTDAAGFPVAPLLLTVGDAMSGRVEHAIRFILPNDRMQRAPTASGAGPTWVWPATHAGGPTADHPDAPIYGSRFRLRASFDAAARGIDTSSPAIQAILYGLQHYGMVLADGGDVPLTAEDDTGCGTTWADLGIDSHSLFGIRPGDFEVIDTGGSGNGYDCVPNAAR